MLNLRPRYVRNIPMSAVLDRGGLRERWLAVYPPGDPQNLHFDPFQVPREGSPQASRLENRLHA